MALILTIAGVLFFGAGGGRGRIPPDATIGVTYAVAAAMGIILISKAKTGEAHDIFLQGNILGITRSDTLVLLAVAIPVLLVHAVFYKEFLFVSFDRETARTLGYRVNFWNLLLYFTLVGESDTSRLLVLSQVVLSLQLPFTIIPLLRFVGSRQLMGEFALGVSARIGSWALALLILSLNVLLIFEILG